jgi:hypothetical protein
VRLGNLLQTLRDALVRRSLIGKRKLDRTQTRRALDGALLELGERYRALVRAGRVEVPAELAGIVETVKGLEERLDAQGKDIEALRTEQPSTT